MKQILSVLFMSIFLITQAFSSTIVEKHSYKLNEWKPGLSEKQIDELISTSQEALDDMNKLKDATEELRKFITYTSNEALTGTLTLGKIKKVRSDINAYSNNELKKFTILYESMLKKYQATDPKSLNINAGKVINPPEYLSVPLSNPANAFYSFLSDKLVWFDTFLSDERYEAIENMMQIDGLSKKLSTFQQTHEHSYGLPSNVEELEKYQRDIELLNNNEVAQIKSLSESLFKQYNVASWSELSIKLENMVKPFQYLNGASFIQRHLEWLAEFQPKVAVALNDAKQDVKETQDKLNAPKTLTDFPGDTYEGDDINEIRAQMLSALLGQITKSNDEVLNISVRGKWITGTYTDSKKPYRKIVGTVMFSDTDGDDVSRYQSYTFMSDSTGDGWQSLRYRAIAFPDGWTKTQKSSMDGSGQSGFMSSLLWLLLAIANIAAGLIAAQTLLKGMLPVAEKVIVTIRPYSLVIGLIALGIGAIDFVLSILSLNILANIIPQLSGVVLGFILASDFIKQKAAGKMKEELDGHAAIINEVKTYSGVLGLAGVIIGLLSLVVSGGMYII